MSNKTTPKKWTEVYSSDEESKFFISLARNTKYEWRSVAAIAKESQLRKEKVEQIITKYYKLGMVFQNPQNEDHWAYWERVPELLPEKQTSICEDDKKNRINKSLKKE